MIQSTGYDLLLAAIRTETSAAWSAQGPRLSSKSEPISSRRPAQSFRYFPAALAFMHSRSHPAAFEDLRRSKIVQKNVVLNNCALAAKPGEQTLFENTSSDMSSLLPLGQDGWGPHLPRLLRAHAVHRKIYAAAFGSPFASISRKCRSIRGHFSKPSCTTLMSGFRGPKVNIERVALTCRTSDQG